MHLGPKSDPWFEIDDAWDPLIVFCAFMLLLALLHNEAGGTNNQTQEQKQQVQIDDAANKQGGSREQAE